jgi:hypothetical protein
MRFWVGAGIAYAIGAVPGTLLHVDVLAVIGGVLLALVSMYVNLIDQVYYCPHCRKRVKMDAAVCHHCGRTVR